MPSIPRQGGILHLPEALELYPDHGLVLYHRVSSWEQAGKGKGKLAVKTDAVLGEVLKVATDRLLAGSFSGVEEGKLSVPRPMLEEAARYAKQHGDVLVAADLSRFIRSESYYRPTNNEVLPTPKEYALLRERTGGVVLATLLHPATAESERHSWLTRLTGKAGRPRSIGYKLALNIFKQLGMPIMGEDGRVKWEVPLSVVARRRGVTKSAVQRLVESQIPGAGGLRWKDVVDPAERYRRKYRAELERGVGVGQGLFD